VGNVDLFITLATWEEADIRMLEAGGLISKITKVDWMCGLSEREQVKCRQSPEFKPQSYQNK
jgi:hypothetical protein